jgi:hypothetical protein
MDFEMDFAIDIVLCGDGRGKDMEKSVLPWMWQKVIGQSGIAKMVVLSSVAGHAKRW